MSKLIRLLASGPHMNRFSWCVVPASLIVLVTACGLDSERVPAPLESATTTSNSIGDAQAAELASFAEYLGITDPPPVPIVREVTPDEQQDVLRECMQEAGFPVEDPDSMILEWDIAAGQDEALSRAIYTCRAEYPIAERYQQPLGPEQLGVVYDHYVTSTIPCLARLGYTVKDIPSRETYIAGAMWDPRESTMNAVMADVAAGRWSDEEEVYGERCPTTPPNEDPYAER